MRDVLPTLLAGLERGEPAALATVVRTWHSSPCPPGTAMLVTSHGEAVGSVSGGCVEGAVFELGTEVIAGGVPVLASYGVSDDDAFAVGLTCGGTIEVLVERVTAESWPEAGRLAGLVAAGDAVAVATVVRGSTGIGRHLVVSPGTAEGSLGPPRLEATVAADALGMLASGTSGVLRYGPDGERLGEGVEVFVASFVAPPRLLVFGAADYAAALTRAGRLLGFRVTVVDARAVFATAARFPDADEVVVDWPHRWLADQQVDARAVICVLTHDPKFDVPALAAAVRTPAAYIGAMGSRRTHDDRVRRLREAGLTAAEIDRIHSPIGLDLGARTPEETAVSIAAEIVRDRWGGSGAPLSQASGPIHGDGAG